MEFPPLSAYGAIGNGERIALVDRTGSIDWCCFPHLESASVFARILDLERGGHFAIRPTGAYDAEHRYVERTNVLETVFETDGGRAVLTDVMPVIADVEGGDRLGERYQESIYRKLTCEEGTVEFGMSFAPRFDYARASTAVRAADDGVVAVGGDERLHLHGNVEYRIEGDGEATATGLLSAGETRWFCAQYGHDRPRTPDECERLLEGTIEYWREWIDQCAGPASGLFDGPWADAVARSALTLKLLIHRETGAIPAAATTSIPEEIGDDRNWDYRYNWLRDAKFTVQALYNIGQKNEAHEYFDWFLDIVHEDPAEIRPAYDLHGGAVPDERVLDHLSGYRGSTPVRIGNAATDQRQLDIYGTIVQGIYETVNHDRELSEEGWIDIRDIVSYVAEVWREPDAGIWEFRGEPRHYVHSKLLCWVALDRGIELADEYGFDAPLERWTAERRELRSTLLDSGYSESAGSFVQYFESETAIDATALLIPIYGFLSPDDGRVQATIDSVLERLATDDGLVYRFRGADVGREESSGFLLCSFWLVDALVLSGRFEEAEDIFTSVLERTTPLGLLSEKVDPVTGTRLGNFPQAFSHIGLINSAIYLQKAKENGTETELEPSEFGSDGVDTLFQKVHSKEE